MKIAWPVEWRGWLFILVGMALVLSGAHGFYVRGHVGPVDALVCGLLLLPGAVLLLVTDYVLQHATLVAVMPLAAAALLVRGSPAFSLALGVMLLWLILRSA